MSNKKLNFVTSEADLGLRLRMEDIDTIQDWVYDVDRYTLNAFLSPFSKVKIASSPSTLSGITGVLSVDVSSGSSTSDFRFNQVSTDEYMLSPTYADCYINSTTYGLCRIPEGSSATRNYSVNTYWLVYVYERLSNQVKDVKLRNHYINKENVILFSTSLSGSTDQLLGTLKIGNPFENNGASLGEIVDGNELKKFMGVNMIGSTNNGLTTYSSAGTINVEQNLTFDGNNIDLTGDLSIYGLGNGIYVDMGSVSVKGDVILSGGGSVAVSGGGDVGVIGGDVSVTNGNLTSYRTDVGAQLTLHNGNESNTFPIVSLFKDQVGETTMAQVNSTFMLSNNPLSYSFGDLNAKANIKIAWNTTELLGTNMTSATPRSVGGSVSLMAGSGSSGYTGIPAVEGGPVTIQGGTGGSASNDEADAGNGGSVKIVGGTGGGTGFSFNDGNGGDVYIAGGSKGGDAIDGDVYLGFEGPGILNASGRVFAYLASDNTGVVYVTYDTTTKQLTYGLTTSDIQFKHNLVKIDNSISKINSLNGYTFNFNDDAARIGYTDTTTRFVGVIAQEVELVMPELVKTSQIPDSEETFKSVDYDKVVALLIEGIKEQQVMINNLTQRIVDLEV